MKKLLLFILLLLIPITVKAASGYESYNGTYKWNYEDGVLTITSEDGKMIRDSLEHQWDPYKSEIKKIVFEGIDVIHKHNFENYPNLEEVILPKSMPGEIADYAFYNCPKLDHIELPEVITRIGKYAFYGTSITEVRIPIFLSWIDEHAFPDGTNIIKEAEELGVIDAGTGGRLRSMADTSVQAEGTAGGNTCYNKYYFGSYYGDTARWVLYEDGTLVVSGKELISGYSGSRQPWGCYKKQIKKIVINEDIEGKITVDDNVCNNNTNVKLAIYTSKPVEEIMGNRIKSLNGNYIFDCRENCLQSSFNLTTVVINRGVETIGDSFWTNQSPLTKRDFYINKYVKTINSTSMFLTDSSNPQDTIVHLEVSPEDYINNGYNYSLFRETGVSQYNNILDGSSFISDPLFNSPAYKGKIINDIDDTYVSINDNSAPDTIEVDGKTYYKYETYITNGNGITNVSLPKDDSVEYVVKEIEVPEGCMVKGTIYKINTTSSIDLLIETNPEPELEEANQENPLTKDYIIAIAFLSFISIILVIYCTRKERYYQ